MNDLPAYDFSTQAILIRGTVDPRALASAVEATVLAHDIPGLLAARAPRVKGRSDGCA